VDLTKIEHLEHVSKELLRHASVADRIDAYLEDMNSVSVTIPVEFTLGNAGRPKGVFSASMVGSLSGKSLCSKFPMGCARQLYYAYLGTKSEGAWEPRMRRRLDEGTAVHALLQSYLSCFAKEHEDTEQFEYETRISPDENDVADQYDLSGHVDGVYLVHTPKGSVRFGVEFKTINDGGFKATSGPHAEHLIQGTIYQKCLDLPLMVFLYWNVNDGAVAEYVQQFDPIRWDSIVDKVNMVRECALKNEEPDREVSFSCRNCQFKGTCKPPRALGKLDRNVTSAFRTARVDASREAKE